MSQTPLLATRARSLVPVTGSGVGSDPGTTTIPGDPTNVDDALAALQAEIEAIGTLTVTDGVTPLTDITIATVPAGGATLLAAGNAGLNFLTNVYGGQPLAPAASVSGAITLDVSTGNWFDLTLTGNVTSCAISNPPPSAGEIFLIIRQGGTGSYTFVFPASFVWQDPADGTSGGSAPTLWTAVGAIDIVGAATVDGGTTWGAWLEGASGSPLTTKGDLWGFSTLDARLPVGTDGTVLTADSTASLGVSYQAPASVGPQHVHVDNVVFSGDGSTTDFILPAAPADAYSVSVYVTASRSQDWTLSGTLLDTLTFGSAPASATDNIVVDIVAAL